MVTEFLHQMNFKSYRLFVDAFAFTRQKRRAVPKALARVPIFRSAEPKMSVV